MDHKDKDIDKLFRDGLGDPDIPFDEGAWDALEKRLDAHKPKRRVVPLLWIGLSGIAAAILLVFLFGLWPVKPSGDSGNRTVQQPVIATPPVREVPRAEEDAAQQEDNGTKPLRGAGNAYAAGNTIENEPSRWMISLHAGQIGGSEAALQNKWGAPVHPGQLLVANDETIIPDLTSRTTEKIKPVKEPKGRPYLSILAAPDLSGVQGVGDQQLSSNVGLLYTLPVTGKFSISAGALYSKKNYNTPYSKYGRTFDKWYSPSDQVYANCDVLEIPVLLNYQLYTHHNTSIQVSTGLSSYFMLHEKYNLTASSSGEPVLWSYEVSGKNNHPFGIANASVMIEQRISNKFSIGLNPFVKLPLTGIGDGRLKLQSQGIAVSVNFKLGGR